MPGRPAALGFIIGATAGLWLGLFVDVMWNGIPFRSFLTGASALLAGAIGAIAARPPRCPWWARRGFWVVAVVIWLLTGYPLSYGPVRYAGVRLWIPNVVRPLIVQVYAPLEPLATRYEPMSVYIDWCQDLARAHR